MIKFVDKIQNVDALLVCYENDVNFCVDDFVDFFGEFFDNFYFKNTINLDEMNYFYLKFPKIFSIFLDLISRIFSLNEFEKMFNFFCLVLNVISNKKKIKKIPFYKLNNKKIKIVEFLIISLLQNVKNFNENEKKNFSSNFLMINNKFSLQFNFNLKIFEYLFNFLMNFNKKIYLNFFIEKIIFELKNFNDKNNNKKMNILFIFCLEKIFFFIKNKIDELKNFEDLIKNENKIILNFIQNFYLFYNQILKKKLNNNFNFIRFLNYIKNYLNNKNENENFDLLNIIFYLKLIKYGIKFFNNNLILIEKKNNFFSFFLKYIEKCSFLCEKLNFNKEKIEFIKKIFFLKENFNFIDYFYSNKNNIKIIILFFNNLLNDEKTNENFKIKISNEKKTLIKLFKIDLEKITLKTNENNFFINKIFLNQTINKFSPWEMPKEKYKEFFILFYFFRFLSLIIDFFKGNKIEDFTKPKTNLRQFCNINYLLRIFSVIFIIFSLIYFIKILNNNY